MPESTPSITPATQVVSLGRPDRIPGAPVGISPTFTSTYEADGPVNYARAGNPTWTAFEEAVGALEGGSALTFSSGMAAVSAVLSLVPVGGTVAAPFAAYNGVVVSLTEADPARLTTRWVDVTDDEGVVAALDGADLLWLESPTNPLLDVADLEGLLAAARERGVLTAVDNTFATPLLQRPLDMGADVVVHSATKYLSGHSDVILGVTVTRDGEAGDALRDKLARHRLLGGAIAGPMETWLALRGLRTLAVRLERACANATELASRLHGHTSVERVRYPGFGAIVSIETVGGADGAERVATSTALWSHSTSLGGVESQVERRRRQPGEPESTPVNLLRLSVGIEDVDDLWRDLSQALDQA